MAGDGHFMTTAIRLLPFAIGDGAGNMAADEAMLGSAADGVASLRFYSWSPATASLGYFQTAAVAPHGLPWVRRSTGGATLVHHHELTYALALTADSLAAGWIARMHEVIRLALARFDVETSLVKADDIRGEVLCFQKQTVGDLICHGHKVVGSAQRKHRRSLLQHGSILLRQSPWTPELPGIEELTGKCLAEQELSDQIVRELAAAIGWSVEPGEWTSAELAATVTLRAEKFGHASWNDKR